MSRLLLRGVSALLLLTLLVGCTRGAKLDRYLAQLDNPSRNERIVIALAIADLGPEILPRLLEALEDESAFVREGVIMVITMLRTEARSAAPQICESLKDEDAGVRSQAAAALGEIGSTPELAVQPLIKALKDPERLVRLCAAQSLGEIGRLRRPDVTVPALAELLADADQGVSKAAGRAIGKFGPRARAAVPALRRLLSDLDRSPDWAAYALGEIGIEAKDAIPELIAALKSPEEDRGSTPAAARKVRKRSSTPAPRSTEGEPAPGGDRSRLHSFAAAALGNIGPEARGAIEALADAVKENKVRDIAGAALARIGPDALPALTSLLQSDDAFVRESAAEALGKMGGAARPAVDALTLALKDREQFVQDAAAEALQKIRG